MQTDLPQLQTACICMLSIAAVYACLYSQLEVEVEEVCRQQRAVRPLSNPMHYDELCAPHAEIDNPERSITA